MAYRICEDEAVLRIGLISEFHTASSDDAIFGGSRFVDEEVDMQEAGVSRPL